MSDASSIKKIDSTGNNTGSISGVLNIIQTAFDTPQEPVVPILPDLIMVGANNRTGLSASEIAAKIISRQSQAGYPVGDVFADGPNRTQALLTIMVEEIINAILTQAKVEMVVPPGVSVTSAGANAGGPIVTQGATTNMGVGVCIIR